MSNHPTAPHTSTDHPTATYPTRRSVLHPGGDPSPRPFAGWRDATPTELLPVVGPRTASTAAGTAVPRVSTHRKPTRGREARRTAPTGTKGLLLPTRQAGSRTRLRRHLRAALAALLIAAAILVPMQLFAAQGISSARQAALASSQRDAQTYVSAHTSSPSPMSGQSPAQSGWVTEHTGAAFDRTNPAASPLALPRCTTSPDTPLPCLATISPSQTRVVVLEEDASLTALVRQ